MQKAADLDPLSPTIQTCIPTWYYYKRDFDEAIRQSQDVIDRFPDFMLVQVVLAQARFAQGQYAEALSEIDEARGAHPNDPLMLLGPRTYALARLGRTAEARRILARFKELEQKGQRVRGPLLFAYCGLGEFDQAVAQLEKIRRAEGLEENILYDPFYDELRDTPSFEALLQRAGLIPHH